MTSLLYRGHRFGAKTATLELRSIYLPAEASWLAEYLHEVTVFSKGKYDDQADSPLSSSNGYKKPGPNDGYYEWLRMKEMASAKPNSIGRGNEALSRVVPRDIQRVSPPHPVPKQLRSIRLKPKEYSFAG